MAKMSNAEIRDKVTSTILEALNKGVSPWRCPWQSTGGQFAPHNAASGHTYSGVNVPHLLAVAALKEYPTNQWLTFRQAKELGGTVRKGEKSSMVVFTKPIRVEAEEGDPEADAEGYKRIFMLRATSVFNVAQCDGLTLPKREVTEPAGMSGEESLVKDTLIFARQSGATVNLGGNRAFYRPATDEITVPNADQFTSTEGFAATLLHELAHWTGAEHRLNRTGGLFGSPEYAFEELVAELGAAMLCHARGVGSDHVENHAAYIESWQRALRDDSRAIFQASKLAEEAVEFLMPEPAEQAEAA